MDQQSQISAKPLLAQIQRLFSRDLALENDYLRQETKILRRKLGARVPLTEADRRVLIKYDLRIPNRLGEVISIGREAHGVGANMDNMETHDERPVIPWTCFSIEPAFYLPNFGVRTEINLFVEERDARVTGEIQTEFVKL